MQHNIPLISIITTFYNEENYLDRCLQSIVNQSFKNFELILVNDGSTDNSIQIVQKYVKQLEFVKVITIENSGAAAARNVAMQNVTSKYVTFLDADDELFLNMIETFSIEIVANNCDLYICDFQILSENGLCTFPSKWHPNYTRIKKSTDLLDTFYKQGIVETLWCKVFLTEIAKKITFHKNLKLFDDRPFVLEFILLSNLVTFIPKKLLKIYCRKSSLTRRILSEVRLKDVFQLFEIELNVIKKYGLDQKYKKNVFKNTLDYFMDTFLIQIIDKKEMLALHDFRNLYQKLLNSFSKKIKSEKINFTIKNKIALFLLKMPNFLGWKFTNLALSVAKSKRIQAIKNIKNQ